MYTKDISSSFERNLNHEWLVTNGIGGYASSTIIGANTRKYHGLLVASLNDNLERVMTLSKVNEYIVTGGKTYSISSNECRDYVEKGYVYQTAFERKNLPEFLYEAGGVELSKKIAMQYGSNKVCLRYDIANSNSTDAFMTIVPLVNYRNFHAVCNAQDYKQSYKAHVVTVNVSDKYKLFMRVSDTESDYKSYKNTFYNNLYYRMEEKRGFEAQESLYMTGEFRINIPAKSVKTVCFVAELNDKCTITDKEMKLIIREEEIRLEKVCKIAGAKTELEKELAISADQFIISKKNYRSIIAGYHWFSDWGRDTFISLEGLTLKTNRFPDAKLILKYFANNIRRGLVPNFIEGNQGGSYNTCDASLWYIEAVYRYFKYTGDYTTIRELFPHVLEIIHSYISGTDYNIYMDKDGLIVAGNQDTNLTWMDAKTNDVTFTPRYGKPVEISALWYNALKAVERINEKLANKFYQGAYSNSSSKEIIKAIYELDDSDMNAHDEEETRNLFLADKVLSYYDELKIVFDGTLSKKVKESFKKFYNDDGGLFDTIEPFVSDIRPNQIIALSLSFPVLSGDKAIEIMTLTKDKLYTEKGLKTLDSDNPNYAPRYEGDAYKRDSSYHQGTIWPWLLGEYKSAYEYVYEKKFSIDELQQILNEGMIGSVAEIYDADEPRLPEGALAQAWSVSALINILR